MTTLPLTQRFRGILVVCILVALLGAGCSLWRDWSHQSSRADSAEAEKRLELAVRSLKTLPDNSGATISKSNSSALDKLGVAAKSRSRLQERLHNIDRKLAELIPNGRVKGRYYLDLDVLINNVKDAQKEQNTLYGSVADTVTGAIRLLEYDETLKKLIWREDLAKTYQNTSVYWSQYVAKVSEGFLSVKNAWGPVMGSFLVEAAPMAKADISKKALLRVTGPNVTYPDGRHYEDVRQHFESFELSGEPSLASALNSFLDYGFGKSLVNRKNQVIVAGRSVPAGYDVVLTLDPALQSSATELTENALKGGSAKNATLVAMDLKTGEILAAAGSTSETKYSSKAVPLVFREILPASTVKIMFSAAMLEQADHFSKTVKGQEMLSQLPYYLMKSDPAKIYFPSAAFDYGGAALFSEQATRFGWNQGCAEKEQMNNACGRKPMDYLFGSDLNGEGLYYPLTGRIFLKPEKKGHFRALVTKDFEGFPSFAHLAQSLDRRPRDLSQAAYDNSKVVRLSMFGQGDVHTSAFGLLNTIGHVANAANGLTYTSMPHMVRRVLTSEGKKVPTPEPIRIPAAMKPENARILAGYLTAVNSREGTAGAPFEKIFGRYPNSPQKELLFGKTGTTDSTQKGVPALSLYVAAYSRNGTEYDTAVVAVIERDDLSSNYNWAADTAFRFIKATRPELIGPETGIDTQLKPVAKRAASRAKKKQA